MEAKIIYTLVLIVTIQSCLFAQDWTDSTSSKTILDWTDQEDKTPLFFIGINVGAYAPNKNTAIIYSGTDDVTNYGINYILNVPSYKQTFDTYFQHAYSVEELPLNPTYKLAFNIGVHSGINLGSGHAIFLDINTSKLNYERVFTIAIDDQKNKSVDPTYEQIPIIGNEKRINSNLGIQLSLYHKNQINFYWSAFGNFNKINLERNYIVIANQEYQISHRNPTQPNKSIGGIGFGGGSGLGFKYNIADRIWIDFTYNYHYTKSKMNDSIQSFGGHQGMTFRIIWN
jgi:opacity protein-like surface antigen